MQTVYYLTRVEMPSSPIPDTYKFNPNKKWKLLQKMCFAILEWIGAHKEEVEVRRVRIDGQKIIDNLCTQHKDILQNYSRDDGARLLMGPIEFSDLSGEPSVGAIISPSIRGRWCDGEVSFCGMEITVLPWMEGMLVVPERILRKRE